MVNNSKHDYSGVSWVRGLDGKRWYQFTISYNCDEGNFSFEIYATSWEHAAALVTDIRNTAKLEGIIIKQGGDL